MNRAIDGGFVRHLRHLADAGGPAASDAALLQRFCESHDHDAFAAIVRRHGRLVFAVCRHVLDNTEDAEDAFQATFFVLARRARSVRNAGALSAWLHGVAHRTALRARRDTARRRARELRVHPKSPVPVSSETALLELQALLDAEVEQLPEPYRTAFILCALESRGIAEVAALLQRKPGTVSGQLSRARALLLRRLALRGVTLSAALTAAALECQSANAAVPPYLSAAAVRAATTGVAGHNSFLAPVRVLNLTRSVGRARTLVRLGTALVLALTTGLVAVGLGAAFAVPSRSAVAQPPDATLPGKAGAESPDVPAAKADLLKDVDRTIAKEPAYETKSPRYGLLVFGPRAKDRVWLVLDGATLYVDRRANGDLTDPDDKIRGERTPSATAEDAFLRFKVDDLHVGGHVHTGLQVYASLVSESSNSVESRPNAKAALAADPKVRAFNVTLEVDWPRLNGKGTGGRVIQMAGTTDGDGALLFGTRPADAPVIHFVGPLQMRFEAQPPVLKLGWDNSADALVGTAGRGPGTFAKVVYYDTVPDTAVPVLEATFPPARAGDPPVRARYEFKDRCCSVDFLSRVRPPESAGVGTATLTLALTTWQGVHVDATTHKTEVVRRGTGTESVSPRFLQSLVHPDRKARTPVVHFSADGSRLLVGGHPMGAGRGFVQVWEIPTGKEHCCIELPGSRLSARFAELPADGSSLYVPFLTGKVVRAEEGGRSGVRADYEGAVAVYDPDSGQLRNSLKSPPGCGVVQMCVAPDGKKLIKWDERSVGVNGTRLQTASLWDTRTATTKALANAHGSAAFTPDSGQFVLCINDGKTGSTRIKLFDSAGSELAELIAVKGADVRTPKLSPDGRRLVFEQFTYSTEPPPSGLSILRVWDLATRKEVAKYPSGGKFNFMDFALSTDGRRLSATDHGGSVRVWDVGNDSPLLERKIPEILRATRVAFAPDGRRLAIAAVPKFDIGSSPDLSPDPQELVQPRVYLFDTSALHSEPEVIVCPHGLGGGLAWSPDGKFLAFGGTGEVHLFDMTGKK